MANLTDIWAQGMSVDSTDSRAGTTATDSTTNLADYLIVFPFGATNTVAAPSRGIFYGCDGQNGSATEKWLFIFDFATSAGSIPANGALPISGAKCKHVIDMPPNTTNKGQFGFIVGSSAGESFSLGLVLVVSTTGPGTLTVDGAKTTFISVGYTSTYPGWA